MIVSIRTSHLHSHMLPHAWKGAPHTFSFLPYLGWRLKIWIEHKSNNIQTSFFNGDRLREQPITIKKCFIAVISSEPSIFNVFWKRRKLPLQHESPWNVYKIHGAKNQHPQNPTTSIVDTYRLRDCAPPLLISKACVAIESTTDIAMKTDNICIQNSNKTHFEIPCHG